jgi:hypothetical protein
MDGAPLEVGVPVNEDGVTIAVRCPLPEVPEGTAIVDTRDRNNARLSKREAQRE